MNSDRDTLAGGLPHSEIPGSPIARISPGLFAACHVLHRLSVPRHPPDALASRLITASPSPAMPHHRRAQGQAPCRSPQPRRAAASMKTLLSDTPGASLARAAPAGEALLRQKGPSAAGTRPVRLGHITTLSSPVNQHPAAVARGAVAQSSPNVAAAPCRLAGRTSGCHRLTLPEPGFAGGGGERVRTDDLLLAKQALSQLSYTPAPGIRRQDRVSELLIPDPVSDA
jgi:hypothetical protein